MKITMAEVAQKAGVSRALVSLAYRNASGVSDATRERILAVGESLGYVPNSVAAQLAARGRKTIGVFIQDLHNEVFADIYDGIRSELEKTDIRVIFSVGKHDGSYDSESLRSLQQSQADVVIALGLTLPDQEVKDHSRLVPIVIVEREIQGLDSVTANSRLGGKLATEYLISLGHRDITFLMNPPWDGGFERRGGYEDAMAEAGLKPRIVQTSYLRSDARQVTHDLLKQEEKISAIFAHNDRTALGVLDALSELNLKPGKDISVVGYDNTEASQAPGTSLTTVDVQGYELGVRAARLALERLVNRAKKSESSVAEPILMVRRSTGAPYRSS